MSLQTYRRKRDFKSTTEPRGQKRAAAGHRFVVQKHAARRLHYDFRLELDGVLKSWAVTRGPSLVPGERRLAVEVEDHPLDYAGFEGKIPEGGYGAGAVIIWDEGEWTPVGDPHVGLAKGHLQFELHGEKLRGRWHLARMAKKPREKHDNWLLIKSDDAFARASGDEDILEERPDSVKTGRGIDDVAAAKPTKRAAAKDARRKTSRSSPSSSSKPKNAPREKLPNFVPPELATLSATPPAGKDWLHEIKFDGYRLQARIDAGKVKLLTRSGLDWTAKFGTAIPAALKTLAARSALIDGELVVENVSGASDFSALQADLSENRQDRFVFYVFDLLHFDGLNLRKSPLTERKAILATLLAKPPPGLRLSEDFDEDGASLLRHACRLGLEGVVSKRRDGAYESGRSRNWIKSKCSARQEFVIGGFTLSSTSKQAIGSLALGVYEGGKLRHVGRVGTGFSVSVAASLFRALDRLKAPTNPFSAPLTTEEARGLRYVKPGLVAEVEYRAWTGDGHLRHAAFRGLREDKPAGEIVRESSGETGKGAAMARSSVKLTHPDRVFWPDQGVTKEGLADYYASVWPFVAPFITGRALALLRCPEGVGGQAFFQKHAWKGLDPHILSFKDPEEAQPLLGVGDLDGLTALAQAAVLEIHPWGSTVRDWERPDIIVMDLDPGEGVGWPAMVAAAREVRERLERAGLISFVKTSGGKGLHVVAPLKPRAEWPEAKAFTKAMSDSMAQDDPGRYVATIAKAKRSGKILIDYLRNQRGATAVAAYSTRARPGAAVSMPLAWEELDAIPGAAHFTVLNAPSRLAGSRSDPWATFRKAAAPLPKTGARRKKASA